jgi:hypothetical protein
MGKAARQRVVSAYSIERAVERTLTAVALVTSHGHAAA